MALDQHTILVPTGANPAWTDRTVIGVLPNVANAAGSAGATVSIPVTMDLPASYSVQATASQACAVSVSGKSSAGFTVNLTPLSSSASIAAGTVDIVVVA